MICLILAAGYATRLYPLTENFPKPLLDVQGRTVLDWLLSDVDGIEGIEKYVVVSNHKFYDHFTAWKESCSLSHPMCVLARNSTDDGVSQHRCFASSAPPVSSRTLRI